MTRDEQLNEISNEMNTLNEEENKLRERIREIYQRKSILIADFAKANTITKKEL
jgi:hypothetical protein